MAENQIPRFFKVFLSETASHSLALPSSYIEHLADPLPKTAKLQGTGGRDWTVSLKKIREDVYFTTGWSKFVEDHELVNGEFLTFEYDGHRTFEVSVYGHSGCKETRALAEIIELSGSDPEEETSMDVVDDDNSLLEVEEISQSVFQFNVEETESDVDAAVYAGNLNSEALTNPHFSVTIKKRFNELLIPANVVKQHKLKFGDSITYIDEVGTLIGKRGKWTDDRICFKGWNRICRRNRLEILRDTVECELLHDQNKKVHSIRVHVMQRTT